MASVRAVRHVSYGIYSYGIYSYGISSYGIYSCGIYSYGIYSCGVGSCGETRDSDGGIRSNTRSNTRSNIRRSSYPHPGIVGIGPSSVSPSVALVISGSFCRRTFDRMPDRMFDRMRDRICTVDRVLDRHQGHCSIEHSTERRIEHSTEHSIEHAIGPAGTRPSSARTPPCRRRSRSAVADRRSRPSLRS